MKARSFSHVGITVKNFNEFVRFYWDVFGCPLVGVSDTPPDRVRGVLRRRSRPTPTCKIGWIRCPGGAVLEIFEFQPQQPLVQGPWNRVGLTHFSLNVRNTQKWHDYLVSKGVEIVSKPEQSPTRPVVLLRARLRRQPDRADGPRLNALRARPGSAPLGGFLFRRGIVQDYRKVLRT